MTELTFALLKYGFLILLWVFVWLTIRSLNQDVEALSPRPSRARRRRDRAARRAARNVTSPALRTAPPATTHEMPAQQTQPTLLVIIDGPLAGASVPLSDDAVTLGRAASNTVVLDDEFVSTHHARITQDPSSGRWIIEDLHSTNGTVVNGKRITAPTVLPARVPVRVGATTFELR